MEKLYTAEELKEAYFKLTDEQRVVLDNHIKRGMKTKWLNIWAKKKGAVLSKEDLENPEKSMERLLEWVLIDYEDSLRINPNTRCECGRPLRYRYTIMHNKTGKVYKLGRVHFEEHTGLSPDMVRLIMKGFEEIDLEREEILSKVISHWTIPFVIPLDLKIPRSMQSQLKVRLPLLNRQLYRLELMIREYELKKNPKKAIGKTYKATLNPVKTPRGSAENGFNPERAAMVMLSPSQFEDVYERMKSARISGEEARQLYYFLKENPEELAAFNLKLDTIKVSATRALGKIGNPSIRKWLVEIESL